jgi:hypothetical protein
VDVLNSLLCEVWTKELQNKNVSTIFFPLPTPFNVSGYVHVDGRFGRGLINVVVVCGNYLLQHMFVPFPDLVNLSLVTLEHLLDGCTARFLHE